VNEAISTINPHSLPGGTETRIGLVVYPAHAGKQDDDAGGAGLVQGLTSDVDTLTGLLGERAKLDCSDDPANTMDFPCGSWGWTPTWNALKLAWSEMTNRAKPNTNTKRVIVVVTDGAPSADDDPKCDNEDQKNGRWTRPSYLTLSVAQTIKEDPLFAGGMIYGFGVDGGKLQELDREACNPFCAEGGTGLFTGQSNSGKVEFCGIDTGDSESGVKNCLQPGADYCVTVDSLVSNHISDYRVADIDSLSDGLLDMVTGIGCYSK